MGHVEGGARTRVHGYDGAAFAGRRVLQSQVYAAAFEIDTIPCQIEYRTDSTGGPQQQDQC